MTSGHVRGVAFLEQSPNSAPPVGEFKLCLNFAGKVMGVDQNSKQTQLATNW